MNYKSRFLKPAATAFVLAVIAAVFGMYLKAGDERKTASAPVAAVGGITKDAYARGTMTAFVVKPDRPVVADFTFADEEGNSLSLSHWRGKVILVNLWATWCAPCRKEMPALAALQRDMGSKDFEVVAISVDRKGEEASAQFLKDVGAEDLALYVDPTTGALTEIEAAGLPASLLIDRNGREIGRLLGPAEWNSAEAKALIKAAIAEP
ncbi:hypothetical protein BH10PSE7_BH10PSE7_31310 [soil metagenome]